MTNAELETLYLKARLATLNFLATSAQSVADAMETLSDFPMQLTEVRTDDLGVSVELEVSDDRVLQVLTALDDAYVRSACGSVRVSVDGHSYFLYRNPPQTPPAA